MSSTTLVTGGAGFIGHHLVRSLLDSGRHVRVLDNFSSGDRTRLPASSRLDVVDADIRDHERVSAALRDCDSVVHLAAMVSVSEVQQAPSAAWSVNVSASESLLEASRQAGVRCFVFASSSAVYGDGDAAPRREVDALRPISLYGAQKAAFDTLLYAYAQSFGMATFALRLFNVYGSGQSANGPYAAVLAAFQRQLRDEGCLKIFGDGRQSRDFVHVDDVASMMVRCLDCSPDQSGAYNIGTGRAWTLRALAELVAGFAPGTSVEYLPPRLADIAHSSADISLARSVLGYEPQWNLVAGLPRLFGF